MKNYTAGIAVIATENHGGIRRLRSALCAGICGHSGGGMT
jgi:hypothetical protein